MAIKVGQGPIDIYQGIPFSTVEVDTSGAVPEGKVDPGNLLNPINLVYQGAGTGSTGSNSNLIRTTSLVSGSSVVSGNFYEYNDVIYRCTTSHTWTGTFADSNFIPQGARIERQVFLITDDSTTTLTLTTSNVGRILNLFVNGIQFLLNVDFSIGGTGNKTITFTEALPWSEDDGDTYVEVNVLPDSEVGFGGSDGGGSGTSDHSALSNLSYAASGHTGFEPALTAGTSLQYYRGDKTWATLSTAAVPESPDKLYLTQAEKEKLAGLNDNETDPITVTFGESVPMGNPVSIAQGEITEAIEFSPNVTGSKHGYSTMFKFTTANITPTFSGFELIPTASELDLTSGVINQVLFQNLGGRFYYIYLPSYVGELDDETIPIISNLGAINILQDRFTLQVQSNEAGVIYYAIYSDTTVRTQAQIKAGTGAVTSGNKSTLGNILESVSITGLSPATAYREQVFSEDEALNQSDIAYYDASTTAADTTAPVPTFTPSNGTTNFNRSSNLTSVFNEAIRNIDGTEVTNANVAAICSLKKESDNSDISFSATISADKKTITVDPTSSLPGSTDIRFSVSNFEDNYGNEQTTAQSTLFTTAALSSLSATTLTATPASQSQVDLDWLTVSNVSSWKLEWSPNGTDSWTQIGGTIAAGTLDYSHTGLNADTDYYYRITTVGDGTNYNNSTFAYANATTAANIAPTATASLSGTMTEGQTITGSYVYDDNENDTEDTSATGTLYEFKRYASEAAAIDDEDNSAGTSLANGYTGGTNKTYQLVTGDVGGYVLYWIRPKATGGTVQGAWTKSAVSSQVQALVNYATISSSLNTSYSGGVLQATSANGRALFNEVITGDGSVEWEWIGTNGNGNNVVMGFDYVNDLPATYNAIDFAIYWDASSKAQVIRNGANGSFATISPVSGETNWFKIQRSGTSIILSYKLAGQGSYTTVQTVTGQSTADLYVKGWLIVNGTRIKNIVVTS